MTCILLENTRGHSKHSGGYQVTEPTIKEMFEGLVFNPKGLSHLRGQTTLLEARKKGTFPKKGLGLHDIKPIYATKSPFIFH